MLIDKAVIANWALHEIGHFATFSIDGEDELSGQVNLAWQRCLDRCIALHDWKDFRKTFKLVRSADTPENGWVYEFALPGGRVGEPLKVMDQVGTSERVLRHFDREGNYIYANVEQVWARCKFEQDPQYWDPGWRSGFVTALAGYLAGAVLSNTDLKRELLAEAFGTPSREGAGGIFGRLMAQDRASSPMGNQPLAQDPLTTAHASGASGAWYGRG
ncbi:MAG: hypothetical protein JJ866_15745 [Roseibium sp.]|uniref:hypothetical protein n=1 Tax=Roseibium sp. TaxID=1936156 RepID=UPI001B063032|nr:hypothetical protein [Roseibium sp.]MBO6893396.1 hypothetical protein [Roseibium sp.]MBO6930728.1 hypothetical protein [Roseibium sp.]